MDGNGGLDWKLLGLLTVANAEGPDVARSAAGRSGAKVIWLPTALLPPLRGALVGRIGQPGDGRLPGQRYPGEAPAAA